MPPAKKFTEKCVYPRSFSSNDTTSMHARVYHPATNLLPPTPPQSPTGSSPNFLTYSKSNSTSSFSRQNSHSNGKYS